MRKQPYYNKEKNNTEWNVTVGNQSYLILLFYSSYQKARQKYLLQAFLNTQVYKHQITSI